MQPLKHSFDSLVTEFGMVMLVRLVQPLKQYHPNEVTEFGMVMFVRLVQSSYL